jgi:hypothetical protein
MNISHVSIKSTSVIVAPTTLEEISRYIYAIVFPILFTFGVIGNLLSSLVFSITKLNQTSCGIYFLLLAIADTTGLIGGLHHCLTIGYHIPVPNAFYCRIRNFLLYTSMDIASWMVAAISLDRYLKVKYPINARILATRRLALIVSLVITVIFFGKNMHLTTNFIGDFTDDAADNCDPNPDYPKYMFYFKNVLPWVDIVTYALLPFVIVTICNGLIIYDQYKRRFRLRKRNLDLSLITLLLVSSISLIVCNLPISILSAIYPYVSLSYDTNYVYDRTAFAFDLLRLPSYASLALNFYFYYYTSVLFRQQVICLFQRIFRIQTPNNDIELSTQIYTDHSRLEHRLDSIDDLDELEKKAAQSSDVSSFTSNFYRQSWSMRYSDLFASSIVCLVEYWQ